ncbi:sensor histidine kinase [Syntrophomonas erecta]
MKIKHRLALSMAGVGIISILITAAFMYGSTRDLFSQYLTRTASLQSQQLVDAVTDYYLANGTLEDIQSWLEENPMRPGHGRSTHGMHSGWNMRGPGYTHIMNNRTILIIDPNGQIVGDSTGRRLGESASRQELNQGYPITVDDHYACRVVFPGGQNMLLGNLEKDFLRSITVYSGTAAVISLLIALLLGFSISNKISRPVSSLALATNRLANGELNTRAEVNGDQEIVLLAQNFNLMAKKLEENRTLRENLTADIIHELKTPLAILRGNLESMQSRIIKPNEENLMSLQDEVIRLSKLVDDLELLTRLESGQLPLELKPHSLADLLDALFPIINTMELEGKHFIPQIPSDLPAIYIDRNRILQVLINLLTNAMNYTPTGGEISLMAESFDQEHIHIMIRDNGKGIEPDILPHIFDRFYRVEKSRSRKLGGMGLGLAIARGFVEAHQGKIWAESELGKGSTFHVLLPVWKGSQAGSPV